MLDPARGSSAFNTPQEEELALLFRMQKGVLTKDTSRPVDEAIWHVLQPVRSANAAVEVKAAALRCPASVDRAAAARFIAYSHWLHLRGVYDPEATGMPLTSSVEVVLALEQASRELELQGSWPQIPTYCTAQVAPKQSARKEWRGNARLLWAAEQFVRSAHTEEAEMLSQLAHGTQVAAITGLHPVPTPIPGEHPLATPIPGKDAYHTWVPPDKVHALVHALFAAAQMQQDSSTAARLYVPSDWLLQLARMLLQVLRVASPYECGSVSHDRIGVSDGVGLSVPASWAEQVDKWLEGSLAMDADDYQQFVKAVCISVLSAAKTARAHAFVLAGCPADGALPQQRTAELRMVARLCAPLWEAHFPQMEHVCKTLDSQRVAVDGVSHVSRMYMQSGFFEGLLELLPMSDRRVNLGARTLLPQVR